MVVGNHAAVGDAAGAVLAQLKFAVVPAGSVEDALRIMQTMRPDIVTANAEDAARIGRERPEHHAMVVVEDAMRDNAQLLVDEIEIDAPGERHRLFCLKRRFRLQPEGPQ